ncbi:MAG: DNA polymerase III subunit beta [Syntrophales bacterium]|jgi:DNA polymerase-3 subunit beta
MEFIINREVFLNGLQKTLGVVEKKTNMQILNNVLIRTEKENIKIVATDLEIGLIIRSNAKIVAGGEITLSARKLYEMIREAEGEDIKIQKNDENMVILTCQKSVYRVMGLPADDFPSVIEEEKVPMFEIQGGVVKSLIRRTFFAICMDETRKNLTGVFWETEGKGKNGRIKVVATDGHRLAVAMTEPGIVDIIPMDKGVIIPRKGLQEIRKIVEDAKGPVQMGFHQGMCLIKTEDSLLKVRLIEGEYPDYQRVMPKDKGHVIQLEREKVLHALRRMEVVLDDRYNGVVLRLTKNVMKMDSTFNPDIGEAKEEIEVTYQGKDIEAGFNVHYMIDALDVIDEDQVIIEVSEGNKPGIVRPVGNDLYYCIVMPLRI